MSINSWNKTKYFILNAGIQYIHLYGLFLPILWWNSDLCVYICIFSTEMWVYAKANFTVQPQTSDSSFFFMVSSRNTIQD
jgi:hypothetical protein